MNTRPHRTVLSIARRHGYLFQKLAAAAAKKEQS
jgi:hypothetical protein